MVIGLAPGSVVSMTKTKTKTPRQNLSSKNDVLHDETQPKPNTPQFRTFWLVLMVVLDLYCSKRTSHFWQIAVMVILVMVFRTKTKSGMTKTK